MRNRTYGGVRGRKTKVGRKLLRFPPTRFFEKKQEIFWRYKKNPYLCTRNQEMNATQV